MTLTDTAQPAPASPARGRGQWLIIGVAALLLLVGGGVTAVTYFYDNVELVEDPLVYPVVAVAELPPPVANAFVAAVDPDFYESDSSLITRRYTVLAAGGGEEAGWRTRVRVDKAEAAYTKEEILGRYLNRADYGRGAVGLVAGAQTYFRKPAAQLTVAEAAVLAVRLDPDRPAPRAGWDQVLDTMVQRDWLSPDERGTLTFPG